MSLFEKLSNGMSRQSAVQGTDIGSGAATSVQFLAANGSSAAAFRALVAGDIPSLAATYLSVASNLSDVASKSTSFNNLSPMTTLGDTIYGGTSGTGTRLPGNITAAKQFYSQTGTGSVSAAPAWAALIAGDLPTITLTGDVTGAASGGSIATTIASNAVTNAKLATMAANTVKANVTGGSAVPTDVAAVSAATASAFMVRDANANVRVNAVTQNSTTTATAAGTTTLTVGSSPFQQFTGSTTQTVVLPDATTLTNGYAFSVANRSTGVVTVQANGGGTLQAQAAATIGIYTLISNGTSAGTWDVSYAAPSSGGGGGMAGGGYLAKSANYSLASGDSTKVIGCDTTSAAFNLTFPTPAAGLMFTVKDTTGQFGTNNLTMVRAGSEKIENLAASMILSANYGSWTFYCGDGTNWIIIAH